MKKRGKLLMSLAMFVISASMLIFGVWATTNVKYNVVGQLNFTPTKAYVKIEGSVWTGVKGGVLTQLAGTGSTYSGTNYEHGTDDSVATAPGGGFGTVEGADPLVNWLIPNITLTEEMPYIEIRLNIINNNTKDPVAFYLNNTSEISGLKITESNSIGALNIDKAEIGEGTVVNTASKHENYILKIELKDYANAINSQFTANFVICSPDEVPAEQYIEVKDDGTIDVDKIVEDTENKVLSVPEGVTKLEATTGNDAAIKLKETETLIMPNTIETIGKDSFNGSQSLTNVTIPENSNLTTLGEGAFKDCINLESITLPEGTTTIEKDAFNGCSSLENVVIPSTVTSIGEDAFRDCPNLSFDVAEDNEYYKSVDGSLYTKDGKTLIKAANNITVNILEGTEIILKSAFEGNNNTTNVTIPNSVTTIGARAFMYSGITSVVVPAGATIGINAFASCKSLVTADVYGILGIQSFMSCDNLLYVELFGTSNTEIPNLCFGGCDSLETFIFSGYERTIAANAFRDCSSLLEITIPKLIYEISYSAFDGCSKLAINVADGNSHYSSDSNGNALYKGVTLIRVKPTIEELTIKSGTKIIEAYAFNGCSVLTSLTIPSSVLTIYSGAFNGCNKLNFTVQSGNSRFESLDGALYQLSSGKKWSLIRGGTESSYNLSTITTLNYIDEGAFAGLSSLRSITLPTSVHTLCDNAFARCPNLTSFTFHKGLNNIGEGTFYLCRNINFEVASDNVSFKSNNGALLSKNGKILYYGPASSTYVIPEGVEEIYYSAFSGRRNLTSVTIPETVKSIENYAFFYCTGLTKVVLPESLTTIGKSVFSDSHIVEIIFKSTSLNIKSSNSYAGSNETVLGKEVFGSFANIKYIQFVNECDLNVKIALPNGWMYQPEEVEDPSTLTTEKKTHVGTYYNQGYYYNPAAYK